MVLRPADVSRVQSHSLKSLTPKVEVSSEGIYV